MNTYSKISRVAAILISLICLNASAQISEGFESNTPPPAGWTYTSVGHTTTNPRTGSRCALFNAGNDAIVTPLIAAPASMSFWWRRSGTAPVNPAFIVQTGPSATGPWTQIGSTITSFTTTYQQFTFTFSGQTNIYIRVLHTRTSGANEIYLDDFTVSAACTNVSITNITATDNLLCPTETANLTANGVAGTNAVLTWFTGPGGTGTNLGSSNPLTNRGPGTYYARVTGDCGGPVEQSITIDAASNPSTSFISGNSNPACNGSGITYSVVNTAGSSYVWNVPSGASIASGQGSNSISVNFGTSSGTISVIETNASGCTGSAENLNIILSGCGLDADFSASQPSVCSGGSITFTNTSTGASLGATYLWNFGTGASPSTATGIGPHTITYTGTGSATVSLTVTDGVSNTETKNNFITINALPTVNAGGALASICQGATTAALDGSFGGSATSAIWSDGGAGGTFANNTGSTPNTATYTASATAPASVTLTLTSVGGTCGTATTNKVLSVNAAPVPPVANGNVSPQTADISNNSFIANWNNVPGATSYQVNVSQYTSSTTTETFSSVPTTSSTSYLTRSWTGVGGITYQAFLSRTDQTITSSNPAITLQDAAGSSLLSGSINGNPTGVYFDVQQKFSGSGGVLTIAVEHGAGFSTVTTLGTIAYNNAIQNDVGFPVSGITGPFRIRISNNTAARPCIDNLDIQRVTIVPITGSPFTSASSPLNVTSLSLETQYVYNVVAVNACGNSASSNNVLLTTSCPGPSSASSAFSVSTASPSSLNLSWTNGNGGNRIVIARVLATPTSIPVNNATYAFNTNFSLAPAFGDGFVVYNGNANNVTITGLAGGTSYFFTIYEYNCSPGAEQYLTATSASATGTTSPNNVALSENCTTNSSHQLEWSFGSGLYDGVKIFARATTAPSSPTAQDANFYTGANSDFNLAADYGTRGKLIYDGTGTNVTVSGLTPGVNYTFAAYTYKNNTATVWSTGTTISQVIALNNVTAPNTSIGDQLTNLGWTNPPFLCYDEVMVVANQGAVSFTPTGDGSAYTANSVYAAANQIVYKGTGQAVVVTGLTNGLNYCYRIFVRSGTQWSSGIEICAVPNTVTEFEAGDLAIVAVNTQVLGSGSTDEVCFVAFKDITENTSFFMTDNGFERAAEGLWGDSEGVMRMTRAAGAPVIPAGTVICINGPYTTEPRYDIIVCGALDNANWQVDADVIGTGSATNFDLNSQDQVWITQGGNWTNPFGSQNASYNGNLLYGWSGIAWKENIGNTAPSWTTQGSRLIPGTECFTTDLATVTNKDKTKYTGPVTATTRLGWISRINNPSNWSGFTSNTAYDNAGVDYDYFNECIVFPISPATEVAGRWTGAKDENWFDCNNWDTKTVPDNTIDVVIDNVAGANNDANIDFDAPFAYLYDNEASCRNLNLNAKELKLTGNALDILNIAGNLTISGTAGLTMNDGTPAADGVINLSGNWTNTSSTQFDEGNGTVRFIGNSAQSISCTGGETFAILETTNPTTISLNNNVIVSNQLLMSGGNITTGSQQITLGSSASNIGSLTYTSGIINGTFTRWLNATGINYRFPVGTAATLREAVINPTALPSAGTLSLSFIATNPGSSGLPLYEPNASITQTFSEGYWSVVESNGINASNYSLSLSGLGFGGPVFDSNARIIHRTNNTSSWQLLGSHIAAAPPVAQRAALNSSGEFAIASARACVTSLSTPASTSQSVCENAPVNPFVITAQDGSGTINYQWYSNVLPVNSGGESMGSDNGAQTSSFTPNSLIVGTTYYYLQVSQPGTSCPTITSGLVSVEVSEILTPSVSITAAGASATPCTSDNIVFTATATNAGSNPQYQWYLNGAPVGTNANSYTLSPAAGVSDVYVVITSNSTCNIGATATSNTIITTFISPQLYYQDLDGDGFGNSAITSSGCVPPLGFVALIPGDLNGDGQPDFDCNDSNDDINPGVEEYCSIVDDDCDGAINEGLSATTYYQDNDGDGFGNLLITVSSCTPVLGYVLNNTDCDDTRATSNPSGTEVCNGFDDNCSGFVDEGCGPVNDTYLTGFILPMLNLGSCTNYSGTLLGANPSPEANSTATTGQDVWYYFEATAHGVSVVCNSSVNDILLELQDDLGNTLSIENVVSGIGGERLNYVGLIPGNTYFIAVRNFNSAIGVGGTFTICAQRLLASRCDTPNPTLTVYRCGGLKADFTSANQYIYRFNSSIVIPGSFNNVVGGFGQTTLQLSNQFGLTFGTTYPNVTIDAVYLLPNGMGTVETLVVPGVIQTAVTLTTQPSMFIRTADACPNNRTLSSLIRAEPFICGPVVDYQWEFTQVAPSPGLPVTAFRGTNDRLFRINNIPGVQPGATYSVRIRPIFAGNIPGAWSTTPSCLRILGAATFIENSDIMVDQPNERSLGLEESSFELSLYPNPNNGDNLEIRVTGLAFGSTQVIIRDAIGRTVYSNQYQVEQSSWRVSINFEANLNGGIYFVELISSDKLHAFQRLIIQK